MYSMKNFNDGLAIIELPTCMYRVKPFTLFSDVSEKTGHSLKELLTRQDILLARIEVLKNKVAELSVRFPNEASMPAEKVEGHKQVQASCKVPQSQISNPSQFDAFVIKADPSFPPISLFILKSFLSEQENILCTSYVNSSVKDMDVSLKQKFDSERSANRLGYKYTLTLIWTKSKGTPSLIVSPAKDTPLLGEFVIAKYLARLMSPSYDCLDMNLVAQIDDLLDLASSFRLTGCPITKDLLNILDKRLSRSTWLVDDNISLADIAFWSILYSEKKTFGKLPKNVDKWYNICSNLPQFKDL